MGGQQNLWYSRSEGVKYDLMKFAKTYFSINIM